jgi:hypothetical protein
VTVGCKRARLGRIWLATVSSVAIIAAVGVPGAGGAGGDGGEVQLASGRAGSYQWRASVFRASGQRDSLEPCLNIKFLPPRGKESNPLEIPAENDGCGTYRPEPMLVGIVDETHDPSRSGVVMAFSRSAKKVSIFFRGKARDRTMTLKLLSKRRASKVGLIPFRYTALAFVGSSCIKRIVAYSSLGAVVYDGGPMHCHIPKG